MIRIRKHIITMVQDINPLTDPELIGEVAKYAQSKFNEELTRLGFLAVTEPKTEIEHNVYLKSIGTRGTRILIKNQSIRKKWRKYQQLCKDTPAGQLIIIKKQ